MTRQTVLLFALAFVLLAVVLRHYAAIGVFPQDHVKFTWHQFHQALRDAADAEPHEIYPNLTPVTSDTLSVTTFGYERGFARFQQGASVTMNQTWVTIADELRVRCRHYRAVGMSPAQLSLRVEQLLGLRPFSNRTHVLELRVRSPDLFRPCHDPEIHDHSCELSASTTADEQHQEWIRGLQQVSYQDGGYPWSRLGYTFDWCPQAEDEVGLSEFVVRGDSEVLVLQVWTLWEFCAPRI
eukprot:TRINITY_DN4228_c0_g1_i2.p1 TRINITY_DN4228_c0_g1~~TRINITY_DN4228_c0_g1_i2.p1  ORF type:complete len:239 (+),score=19.66 TRINITY_DN4228_c0_g1_i2:18-734(+)